MHRAFGFPPRGLRPLLPFFLLIFSHRIGTDFDPNDSVLDEIVGFLIAAQGFFFQLTQGFILPFPFNLVLLPLSIVEWLIRSQMSPDMKDWADVSRQLEDVVDVSSFVS